MNSPRRASATPVRSADTYLRLRAMISSGELRRGERLVERELARRFGISRIPLRESLVRLEAEGLVRSVANTATYVEDFSPQDAMEIYSLRLALEPLATRLAALRTTAELVNSLRSLCDRMTELSRRRDWKRLDQADYAFHHAAVVASQHRRLIRVYDFCQIQILGREGGLKEHGPDFTAKEHQRILECIERGDGEGAEKASYAHVSWAMQNFLRRNGIIMQVAGKRGASRAND